MNTVTQYIAENRRQLVLAGGVAMVAAFGLLGEGVEQLGAVFILWGASTPFLYTWDGNRYVMDNDVMFGKPISRFPSLESGKREYEAGRVRPDLYKLQQPLRIENGVVKLQIKEIEPEVSLFEHVQLKEAALNADEQLFVRSDFSGFFTINATRLGESIDRVHSVTSNQKRDLRERLVRREFGTTNADQSHEMTAGSFIDVEVSQGEGESYLLLQSWYRDWTLGEIYAERHVPGFSFIADVASNPRVRRGALAGVFGTVLGFLGVGHTDDQTTVRNTLANAFVVPHAHADTPNCGSCTSCADCSNCYSCDTGCADCSSCSSCGSCSGGSCSSGSCSGGGNSSNSSGGNSGGNSSSSGNCSCVSGEGASMGNPGGSHSNESGTGSYDSTAGEPGEGPRSLIVSYLDKARGQYVTLDVIEPRYARPSTVGVKLPDVAFDIDGNASLRITATKRHKVSGVAVVDGANEQVAARDLVLRRAHLVRTGTDHTDALATPFVGGYIETLPGDVLELEFDGASQGSTNAYLLGFGGVYAPADRKAQRKAGNWTDTLDEQAIAMLAEVYHYSKR